MAAWRYKIPLLMSKKYFTCKLRSLMKYFSTLKERFHISAWPCNILLCPFKPKYHQKKKIQIFDQNRGLTPWEKFSFLTM